MAKIRTEVGSGESVTTDVASAEGNTSHTPIKKLVDVVLLVKDKVLNLYKFVRRGSRVGTLMRAVHEP